MESVIKANWSDYYKGHINNAEKEQKFLLKYTPFFQFIMRIVYENDIKNIREEGAGTGIITKILLFLIPEIMTFEVTDISWEMLELAKENLKGADNYPISFGCYDLLSDNGSYNGDKLIITHGVLEHFSNDDIRKIIDKYRMKGSPSVHCVPTNKYMIPSFGDERLLSSGFWVDMIQPDECVLNGNDLYLFCR